MIKNKQQCCGCTACKAICPKKAISMEPDALGFLYPKVDEANCINCGLCEKVCAFSEKYDLSMNLSAPIAYGARHKNMEDVMSSRSGAAFVAFSDWILEQGGVVYGAGYDGHFRVIHKRADSKAKRDEFRGSKYVQSDLNDTFIQVRDDLKRGLIVLYSGTSCQIAGLRSFVNMTCKQFLDNLFLVDIVCHGAPSPYIWRDYLLYLEKKEGKKITQVEFRDKKNFGWMAHKESYQFGDCRFYTNTYTYTFYQHIMFRKSCGICFYANIHKPSDITIGDFWGWEKTNPVINLDDKGISLILCNSSKGLKLFDAVKDCLIWFPAKIEDCLQFNLTKPTPEHRKREAFELDYEKKGFLYVFKKYGSLGWRFKIRPFYHKLKKVVKRISGK